MSTDPNDPERALRDAVEHLAQKFAENLRVQGVTDLKTAVERIGNPDIQAAYELYARKQRRESSSYQAQGARR